MAVSILLGRSRFGVPPPAVGDIEGFVSSLRDSANAIPVWQIRADLLFYPFRKDESAICILTHTVLKIHGSPWRFELQSSGLVSHLCYDAEFLAMVGEAQEPARSSTGLHLGSDFLPGFEHAIGNPRRGERCPSLEKVSPSTSTYCFNSTYATLPLSRVSEIT